LINGCTGSSYCTCNETTTLTSNGSGTYSTAGLTVTVHTSSASVTFSYCVNGNTLGVQQTTSGVVTSFYQRQ
jgi:hypothetical protein